MGNHLPPLSILLVSQYYAPETIPITAVAAELAGRGHGVEVLTGLPNYPSGRIARGYGWRGPYREVIEGVTVRRVPMVTRGAGSRLRLAANYASFAAAAVLAAPVLCRGPYDVMLAFQPSPVTSVLPATLLRALRRTPLMIWVQDLWPDSLGVAGVDHRLAWKLGERLARLAYRRADRVLMQSQAFAPRLRELGVEERRLAYLPNAGDAHFAELTGASSRVDAELGAGFRILFAGNLGEAQGLETILDAAERLKGRSEAVFVILGDGRRRGWLEAEIARRGLGGVVRYLGVRPYAEMPAWHAAADALLVTLRPDPTLDMTAPSKLQPCLASGRPILAAAGGETARIVEDAGAGLTVPAGRGDLLAEAADRLARMPAAERDAMGRRSRAAWEAHFRMDAIVDTLEASMRELAGPPLLTGPTSWPATA